MAKRNQLSTSVQPGNEYGELTVLEVFRDRSKAKHYTMARCVHSDGTHRVVRVDHLRSGGNKGTWRRLTQGDDYAKYQYTHSSWEHMIDRCTNQSHPHYKHYGGRGIKVCDRWRESFRAFFEDMGERPKGWTIDRIDNDGDYEPSNCKWSTFVEQNRNKTNGTRLTFQNETLSVTEWAEKLDVPRNVIFHRLRDGWGVERALTTPVRKRRWAKRPADISTF